MCGIAGQYFFKENALQGDSGVIAALQHRGPDHQQMLTTGPCTLYHARLSIVDLSSHSNQPFVNPAKTKSMVYNGEIFNYRELAKEQDCDSPGGDVEVLFDIFDKQRTGCLNKLNGFFAFSFYDSVSDELFVVRDRYGEKPLYYYHDGEKICFASELKALMLMCGKQAIDEESLYTYLRLNYISGRQTIFRNVHRLLPGECLHIKNKTVKLQRWYELHDPTDKKNVSGLMSDAVKLRLQADVPVGCFLSGGFDSSVVSALAKQQHSDLHTFSLGFADEPYFDETVYAEQVAKHIGSQHHVFRLKNDDLLNYLGPFLNSIDEPFADSSAFNVFVLSHYTRQHVKVALSGDGADELFMGYNKHRAEWLTRKFTYGKLIPALQPLISLLPSSRNSSPGNKFRQLKRFAASGGLSPEKRYINWASISSDAEVKKLMRSAIKTDSFHELFSEAFSQQKYNPVNYADLKIVLADDMLVKADRMSMRHGLEIRSPFLDYRVVELAMGLPEDQKINAQSQKVILRQSLGHLLPQDIITRPKKGFELPLWKWLSTTLANDVKGKWLGAMAADTGLLNMNAVEQLKLQLFSNNPGDAPAKAWALIVFSNWYANYKEFIS